MSHYQTDKIFRLLDSNDTLSISPQKLFLNLAPQTTLTLLSMKIIIIGIVIAMKAAFERPDSHVVCADGTRIWLQCTRSRSITPPQHLHKKVDCAHYCTLYTHTLHTADSFPSGPESRLGHRAPPPHRHNTNPPGHTFFCPPTSKLQTANQERRPEEISELNIGANLVATLCGVALQIHLV